MSSIHSLFNENKKESDISDAVEEIPEIIATIRRTDKKKYKVNQEKLKEI